MPPKKPKPKRLDVTREQANALVSLLLWDANTAHHKQVRFVTSDVRALVVAYLKEHAVADLAEHFDRAVAACDGDWLTHLYFAPDFLNALPRSETPLPYFPPGTTWEQAENELIRQTLIHARGKMKKAAEILGVSRSAVYRVRDKYRKRVEPLQST